MPLTREMAMEEIAGELTAIFPSAVLTPRVDAPSIMIIFGDGRRPISVRFSTAALRAYIDYDAAVRQLARAAVAKACTRRLREYSSTGNGAE
jgi:hypothetical protein